MLFGAAPSVGAGEGAERRPAPTPSSARLPGSAFLLVCSKMAASVVRRGILWRGMCCCLSFLWQVSDCFFHWGCFFRSPENSVP